VFNAGDGEQIQFCEAGALTPEDLAAAGQPRRTIPEKLTGAPVAPPCA